MTNSKKKFQQQLLKNNFMRRPVTELPNACCDERFKNKKIFNSHHLFNPLTDTLYKNNPSMNDLVIDEKMVCPFTGNPSVKIMASGIDVKKLFPSKWGTHLKFNQLDLSSYNRIKCYIYAKATGYQNFYFNITFGDTTIGPSAHDQVHAPSIIANQWNEVIWELGKIPRAKVERMGIVPYVGGFPPEAEPNVTFYISDVFVEEVEADADETWSLDNRISYSHVGYFANAKKTAIVQNLSEKIFHLKDEKGQIVYEGIAQRIESHIGAFYELDFSAFTNEGDYYISTSDHQSELFVIDSMPYLSSVYKSLNFLRELRCGEDIVGVHSACHLNSHSYHENGSSVPNFGGWHDAGDLSQFEICTAEIAESLLDYAQAIKEKDSVLYERLLEEAKVGISWLLRTTFKDGTRALAILYGVYHPNIVEKDDMTARTGLAENGPFENLLSAACLAKAALAFNESDPDYANWCQRVALEDFDFGVRGYEQKIFTKRWGTNIDSQVCGVMAGAAASLYILTGEPKYLEHGKKAAKIIISCQQQETPNWKIPLRGFFYEDVKHEFMLTYEHRGHEQNPVQGLVALCNTFKNDEDYPLWENALKLYGEYICNTIKYTAPYNLIPGHVYIIGKLNAERFTIPASHGTIPEGMISLERQVKQGVELDEDVYLRIFPVSIQRRGFHATLLSKTKAASLIAKLFNDSELKQIVINQLEWVLGKNPFSSSTMYGEGYNYHPLYVAYSKQFIGALPVGFKTFGDNDIPYWPIINNAVFKEVWGHTSAKYLWVIVDLL